MQGNIVDKLTPPLFAGKLLVDYVVGVLGVSDSTPMLSLAVVAVTTFLTCTVAWAMLRSGYLLKA